MEKYFKKIYNKKDELKIYFFIALFWMLVGHGFALTNQILSHDSLGEAQATLGQKLWKIQLGRIFIPFYTDILRGSIISGWFAGVLGVIYFTVIIFLIVKIFKIKKLYIKFLLAGILITNNTLISLISTFIHDFDYDILSLLLVLIGVYIWNKYEKKYLSAVPFLVLSLGLYQAYLATFIVLVIMKSMIEILEKKCLREVIYKISRAILIVILSGVCYVIMMKLVTFIYTTNLISNSYNSVDKFRFMNFEAIIKNTYQAYLASILILFTDLKSKSIEVSIIINIFILVGILPTLFYLFKEKKISWVGKVVFLIMGGSLPFWMNLCQMLSRGDVSHELIYYAIWLTYIFVLILIEKNFYLKLNKRLEIFKYFILIFISIIIWNNVITSNDVYVKKYLEKSATIAFMNRVILDMNRIKEYDLEKTKVMYIGHVEKELTTSIDYRRYGELFGVGYNNILGTTGIEGFFNYVLHYPIIFGNLKERQKYSNLEVVKEMPNYPEVGSIRMVDDVLIIKFKN